MGFWLVVHSVRDSSESYDEDPEEDGETASLFRDGGICAPGPSKRKLR